MLSHLKHRRSRTSPATVIIQMQTVTKSFDSETNAALYYSELVSSLAPESMKSTAFCHAAAPMNIVISRTTVKNPCTNTALL